MTTKRIILFLLAALIILVVIYKFVPRAKSGIPSQFILENTATLESKPELNLDYASFDSKRTVAELSAIYRQLLEKGGWKVNIDIQFPNNSHRISAINENLRMEILIKEVVVDNKPGLVNRNVTIHLFNIQSNVK